MRLYIVCKNMKWTHLPNPGGLYNQHPKMLDDFMIIANAEATAEKARHAKQERERRAKQGKSAPKRGRRR